MPYLQFFVLFELVYLRRCVVAVGRDSDRGMSQSDVTWQPRRAVNHRSELDSRGDTILFMAVGPLDVPVLTKAVGTFAVQIGTPMGAEFTGVCSTRNLELVRSLGADHVADYSREDFTRGDGRYDFVLDTVRNHSVAACRRIVAPGGRCVPDNGTSGGRWTGTRGRTLATLALSAVVPRPGSPFLAPGPRSPGEGPGLPGSCPRGRLSVPRAGGAPGTRSRRYRRR